MCNYTEIANTKQAATFLNQGNSMKKILLVTLISFISPTLVNADSCNYEKDIEFTIDATSAQNLRVDVGAGELSIRGRANSDEILVTAVACASSRSQLDDMDIGQRSRGSDIEIFTEFERRRHFLSWFGSREARIDIEMLIPEKLALQVDDGSGFVTISGVSALHLEDGSGSIEVSKISGDVYIDDGSGSIEIDNVGGLVSIEDGSGDLKIIESNEVHIIDDGSGGIRIANITRNVHIEDDGSGGIDIQDVGGDVEIEEAGSGRLNVQGVAGNYYADRN